MATKKKSKAAPAAIRKLSTLEGRVTALEHDVHALRNGMTHLTEEVVLLKAAVKQVDERTLRGERLLMEMQGEQLRMAKTLDRIAVMLTEAFPKGS